MLLRPIGWTLQGNLLIAALHGVSLPVSRALQLPRPLCLTRLARLHALNYFVLCTVSLTLYLLIVLLIKYKLLQYYTRKRIQTLMSAT